MRPFPLASLAALGLALASCTNEVAPADVVHVQQPQPRDKCAAVHATSSTTFERTAGPDIAHFKYVAATPQAVFASTGTSLHRSTDGGTTWSLVDVSELRGASVVALASDGAAVYVAGGNGFFRSTDGGLTWQDVTAGDVQSPTYLSSDGTHFFAVQSGRAYQRDELGSTWTPLPSGDFLGFDVVGSDGTYLYGNSIYTPGVYRIALGVSNATWNAVPTLPEWGYTAFAFVGARGFAANSSQIFQSVDTGATWAPVATTGQVYDLLSMGGQLLAATEQGLQTSTDNGATWTQSIDQKGAGSSFSLAASGSSLFFAGDGVRRAQGASAWERLHTVADPIADLFATEHAVFAQSGSQVLRSTDAGATWGPIGDAQSSYAYFVVTHDGIVAMRYSSAGEEVVRSDDEGLSFVAVGSHPGDPTKGFVQFLADLGDSLVAGVTSGAGIGCTDVQDTTTTLFRSTDGGATWKPAMNTFAPTFTDCYKKSFSPGLTGLAKANDVLFATSWHEGAYRSTDAGATWKAITTPAEVGMVSSVVGVSGAVVGIGSAGGIARSVDGGVTWTASGLEGMQVASLLLARSVLYASVASTKSTDSGVYTSSDGGLSWTRVDASFDGRSSRVAVQGGHLFVGTLDDSVWSGSLSCTP